MIAGGGSPGAEANGSAAADTAAAPAVPIPSRGAGSPAGDIDVDAIGSSSRGAGGAARPRKRKAAEAQNPQERLVQQLRGHGRTAASNGNGPSNGLHRPAATTLTSEEVGARAMLNVSTGQPLCAYRSALIAASFINPQDAQPNLANAPPAGLHEPLRLRGDSSGNYLKPEDEAATTDEEVLLLYCSHSCDPLCC